MGTYWVALSIKNIKTRASIEMTSRILYLNFFLMGVNVVKNWHVAGEVFAISDCLVYSMYSNDLHVFHWLYEYVEQMSNPLTIIEIISVNGNLQ